MTPKYQVLPDLPAEEFQALKEDIRRRGVQVPIEITTEDEILDGHQRLRACEQLAIRDYPVKVVAGLRTDQEKRHHAIRANLLRRQLTREQRRTLIADELRRTRGKLSNRVLAGLFACSDHTIATVRRELESGAQIAHLPKSEGRDGKSYPSRRTTSILTPNPREARAAQERLIFLGEDAPEATISLNQARKLAHQKERADLLEDGKHVRINSDQIKIVNADFRTVTLPKKCDLIFCDPPYSREHLTLYGDLGAWAQTNLKRGGYLACYAGHYHLPDVLDQLRKHLDYIWTFVIIHKGYYDTKVVYPHNILASWKPVLLFSNGKPAVQHPTMRDVIISGRSKDNYPHEQPVEDAVFFVGCLSQPGDLVVDVCCGSASSGCAVVRLGERRFIGYDKDKRAIAIARRRVAAEIKNRKPFQPFEPMALNLNGNM